jgi:hypothetical protein
MQPTQRSSPTFALDCFAVTPTLLMLPNNGYYAALSSYPLGNDIYCRIVFTAGNPNIYMALSGGYISIIP